MPWTGHSMGSQRVRHNRVAFPFTLPLYVPTVSCRMPSVTLTLSPNLHVGFLPWNWTDPRTQGELTQSQVPEGCIRAGPCLLAIAASRLCLGPWRRLAGLRALGAGSQGPLPRTDQMHMMTLPSRGAECWRLSVMVGCPEAYLSLWDVCLHVAESFEKQLFNPPEMLSFSQERACHIPENSAWGLSSYGEKSQGTKHVLLHRTPRWPGLLCVDSESIWVHQAATESSRFDE